jgi:NADPH-dependent ferric siderophore reductase
MTEIAAPAQIVEWLDGTRRLTLTVVAVEQPTPAMKRFRLASPDLVDFRYAPGQDLMLWLPAQTGRRANLYRRYTIRALDANAGEVTLDILSHAGPGPGSEWTARTQPGDQVDAVGPRGKITIADAPWHLFIGDESYLPAAMAMLEALEALEGLPAEVPASAIIEVANGDEEQPTPGGDRNVRWLHRGSRSPGDPEALVAAAAAAELPDSQGHVYIGGEARVVNAIRDTLVGRGVSLERMSPKAYWGRGRANAGRGEPDKLPE